MKKTFWSGFTIAILILFGGASTAFASDYTGNCAGVPSSVSGNAIITDSSCTISHNVTASGYISITASGTVSTQNLQSTGSLNNGAPITVSTSGGSVTTGSLTSAGQAGGDVTVVATGQISTGAINAAGSIYQGGNVALTSSGSGVSTGNIDASAATNVNAGAVIISADTDVAVGDINAWGNSATGGDVEITTVSSGAVTTGAINTYSQAGDFAGSITIDAQNDIEIGGDIDATADDGFGGEIHIQNTDSGQIQTKSIQNQGAAGDIHTAGNTDIFSASAVIIDGHVSAGGWFRVKTPDDAMADSRATIIQVNDTIDVKNAPLLLLAGNNVSVDGNITIDNSLAEDRFDIGSVTIVANKNQTASDGFVVGTSSSNGISGAISNNTTSGGDVGPGTHGHIYILNHGSGGITILDGADLSVQATTSKAGIILLDADQGTLSLPADSTISADGTSSYGAGIIAFFAQSVVADNTIVSASDPGSSGLDHDVLISTSEINVGGGLTLNVNGDGGEDFPSNIIVVPQGGITYTNDFDPSGPHIEFDFPNGIDGTAGALNITGTGNFATNANGSHTRTFVSAYPLTFNNSGTVDVTANGGIDNHLYITYTGAVDGITDGLSFNGGAVTLTADTEDTAHGFENIVIFADKMTEPVAQVTVQSNGVSSGIGGNILAVLTNTDIAIGSGAGKFQFAATNPGSLTDGGRVWVQTDQGTMTIDGPTPSVDLSSSAMDARGGTLVLVANELVFDSGSTTVLNADGVGTGDGGIVSVYTHTALSTGTGAGAFTASAAATDTGSGGFIQLFSDSALTTDGSDLVVNAGPNGDGNGGALDIESFGDAVNITGELNADGQGAGDGGSVRVFSNDGLSTGAMSSFTVSAVAPDTGSGGSFTLLSNSTVTTDASDFSVAAGPNGDGNGGNIDIESGDTATITGALNVDGRGAGNGGNVTVFSNNALATGSMSSFTVTAEALDTGSGGSITLLSNSTITTVSADLSVAAGPNGDGNGGAIDIESFGASVSISGELNADGHGAGNGGSVTVFSNDALSTGSMASFTVSAKGADAGNGGSISLSSNSTIAVDGADLSVAAGTNDGNGGNVEIESLADNVTITGLIQANGSCTGGDGGNVTITGVDVSVESIHAIGGVGDETGGGSCVALASRRSLAPLLSGTASGGSITLNASNNWTTTSFVELIAFGLQDGTGGSIVVNNTNGADLSGLADGSIDASGGGDSGLGGFVTIANVSTWPSSVVEDVIHVSGSVSLDESDDDGQIGINDVICQAHNVPSFTPAPAVYWNCNDATLFGGVLTALSSPAQNALNNAHVTFYVFKDVTDATNHLGSAWVDSGTTNLGFTRHQTPTLSTRNYSVVYQKAVIGGVYGFVNTTAFPTRLEGAIRHEAGHQVDHQYGSIAQSDYYKDLVEEDWTYFNGLSTCSLWGSPVCSGGVVQSPYNGHSNREILNGSIGSVGIPKFFLPTDALWIELFAEEYAIAAGGGIDESNGSNNAVLDPWIRGYFVCSQTYANAVYAGGKSGSVSYSGHCSTPAHTRP